MMLLEGKTLENFEAYSHKGIYHIVFNHKVRPYNFFDSQTLEEFGNLISFVEQNQFKGLVLKSGKPSFVVGANIKEIEYASNNSDSEKKRSFIDEFLSKGQEVFNRIEDLGVPSVAIMGGVTMGGGLELALACTSRILIKNPVPDNAEYTTHQLTKLALPEVKLGIVPSWGGTTRLPRIISPTKAIELICSGRSIDESEAIKIRLVDKIVERRLAEDCAYDIINNCDLLGIRSKKVGPSSLGALRASVSYPIIKNTIQRKQKKMFGVADKYPSPYKALEILKKGRTLNRDEALILEREAFVELVQTNECKELVKMFLEKK